MLELLFTYCTDCFSLLPSLSSSLRHVIWASKSSPVATFPGLADAFAHALESNLPTDWSQVSKHMSIIAQAIEGAAHTLQGVI